MTVLVGKPAPDFKAAVVFGDNQIQEDFQFFNHIKGKAAVLFFYPMDFTFVCPSEIIAFNNRLDDFESRQVEVIAVSIDSQFTHLAWKNTPIKDGGIGQVQLIMVADVKRTIMHSYGIESAEGVAFRASFLIDKQGIVRHQVVNDLPLGRNVDEMIRMVDALQFYEENGEVCPAGWQKGDAGMVPTNEGVAQYLAMHSQVL